jgi:hypothetical protein
MKHAPADGYDSPIKMVYRRELWNWIGKVSDRPLKDRHVLILDTRRAHETQFLLKRGYDPAKIHVCNRNPAEVACLTMLLDRLGKPRVNTYGVDFLVAAARARAVAGRPIDVIAFDGCGPVLNVNGSEIGGTARIIAEAREIAAGHGTIVMANMLVGRESASGLRAAFKAVRGVRVESKDGEVAASMVQRLQILHGWLVGGLVQCRWHAMADTYGSYISTNGQRFAWVAAKLERHVRLSVESWLNQRGRRRNRGSYSVDCCPQCIDDLLNKMGAIWTAETGSKEDIGAKASAFMPRRKRARSCGVNAAFWRSVA